MNEIFTSKWFISVISVWVVVLILDEASFLIYRKLNPGSMWSGLIVKHPLQNQPGTPTSDYPNGYRPAGGQ